MSTAYVPREQLHSLLIRAKHEACPSGQISSTSQEALFTERLGECLSVLSAKCPGIGSLSRTIAQFSTVLWDPGMQSKPPTGHQSQAIKLCPLGGSCKTWTARCKNQGTSPCVKLTSRSHSGLWNTAETKWKIAFLLPILWRRCHQPLHVYLIGSQTLRLQLLQLTNRRPSRED